MQTRFFQAGVVAASLVVLLSACGGGGSGAPAPVVPEAVVTEVSATQVLEGNAGTTGLRVVASFSKPVERSLTLTFSSSAAGSARGGDACGAGVDFISPKPVTAQAGASSIELQVMVCGDVEFEATELLSLNWSAGGQSGAGLVTAAIVNDDAGGLNGGGATQLIAGLKALGRDTNPLTNSDTDGALGFAFDKSGACVVDLVTGLTWQKMTPEVTRKAYADIPAHLTAVNTPPAPQQALCGYTDWRLPTANELMNLMNVSTASGQPSNADASVVPAVPADAMSGQFWSADQRAAAVNDAWQVDADSNGVISVAARTSTKNVRLVRGGVAPETACGDKNNTRFEAPVNGTVTDKQTKLMWKTCPEGYTNSVCTKGQLLSFSEMTSVVARLNEANAASDQGFKDWRVPTRNELASLVNRACTSPPIVPSVFPANGLETYVTANVNVNAPGTQVWGVDFTEGRVGLSVQSRGFSLRLVRAGQ